MNDSSRTARRYHWLSEGLQSFVEEPHEAIDGVHQGEIVNLTDRRARRLAPAQLDAFDSLGPDGLARELAAIEAKPEPAPDPVQLTLPHLVMPAHHDVRASDVLSSRPHATFAAAANRGPADFAELLLVPGVGARTVRALAMVAEVVHGAPYRFTDPARFSFAHGGKDRHPFPVPLKVYDETIAVMKSAVAKAKLGQDDGSRRSSGSTTRPAGSNAAQPGRRAGRHRRGAAALACLRRPERLRLGAGARRVRRRSQAESCVQSLNATGRRRRSCRIAEGDEPYRGDGGAPDRLKGAGWRVPLSVSGALTGAFRPVTVTLSEGRQRLIRAWPI